MFKEGFCFSARTVDRETFFIVNVCGHESVGFPLFRSMETVPERFLDEQGIDNLIIPISVGEPKKNESGEYNYSVDVVVHPCLVSRCKKSHHLFQHFVTKLTSLAIEWIQQECGVQLLVSTTTLVGLSYFNGPNNRSDKTISAELLKRAAEALLDIGKTPEPAPEQQQHIPSALDINSKTDERKGPLIREVIAEPVIKKGFLIGNEGELYGGASSPEGEGKVYDSLGHIPESLKSKCKIIDTRTMQETPPAVAMQQTNDNLISTWKLSSCDVSDSLLTVRVQTTKELKGMSEVDLSVSENTIDVDDFHYVLPRSIDIDTVKAKYLKVSRILVITCQLSV